MTALIVPSPRGRSLARRPLLALPLAREPLVTHAAGKKAAVLCGLPREGLRLSPAGEPPACAACREVMGFSGWCIEERAAHVPNGARQVQLLARARWGEGLHAQMALPVDVWFAPEAGVRFAQHLLDALSLPPGSLQWVAGSPVPPLFTADLGCALILEVRFLFAHRDGAGWYGFVRTVVTRSLHPMRLLGRTEDAAQARWFFAAQLLRPWAVARPRPGTDTPINDGGSAPPDQGEDEWIRTL